MKRFPLIFLVVLLSCAPITSIEDPFSQPAASSSSSSVGSSVRPLRIVVIDVGQGDATLVIGPSGKTLLIDAGPVGAGVSAVLPALRREGVLKLDWMMATHYDADHIGGFSEVLAGSDQTLGTEDDWIPIGLLDRGDRTDKATAVYQNYLKVASSYRTEASSGMKIDLGNGANAQVMVANGSLMDGRSIFLNPDEENEACLGVLIRYGAFTYFTAGDLTGGGAPGGYSTKDIETMTGSLIGDIDVLHIGHHGSLTSTNQTFLDEVKPEVAVISVGQDNDYGHPAPATLQKINQSGATLYRTDQNGTIVIQSDGGRYFLQTE